MSAACLACGAPDALPFLELEAVPVHCNLLARTRDEALAADRAPIRLALCRSCGLVYNQLFEPERMRYVEGYETSLHHSGVFQEYAAELARRLVEAHTLRGREVLEIGCGAGDFLRQLCELGARRGVGLDPSHAGQAEDLPGGGRIEIVGEAHERALRERTADLLVCRHVLEHLADPGSLLADVRAAAERGNAAVFFEVPDGRFTLRSGGVWDLIYEHCSYFAPVSLRSAFARAGMRPTRVESVYGGQFLTIEAVAGDADETDATEELAELEKDARAFAAARTEIVDAWARTLAELRGARVALWGAGSKGVTFLNVVPGAADGIERVVDRNPRKRGRFVPGTGQPVVAPMALPVDPPDLVLVTNPLYAGEIRAELAELGVEAEVRAVSS